MAPKDDSEVTALKKELNSLIEKIKVWINIFRLFKCEL